MAESDPLIGATVGPCRIEAFISKGGMGRVYRGRHLALDREVAIKVIEPPLVNGDAVIRSVVAEARAAAKLEDPRIVQVYDVGIQGALCYIVMQLLRGETLERFVGWRRFLHPPEALRIMKDVVGALGAAHRAGIVHRDVKPGNVMLDETGAARLMDFGIAGAVGGSAEAAGTVDFMAPEQALGSQPDPRTDLYACGVMYYFLLTGKLPYPGEGGQAAILRHRECPIPDVRAADPSVTRFAASLISRLMAKTPDGRPANADETLKALDSPEMLQESAVVSASAGDDAPMPSPPPPVPMRDVTPTPVSRTIFLALTVVAFGRQWFSVVQADWMAAGVVSALFLLPFYLVDRRGWLRKTLAVLLFAGMCLSFYKFGLPGLSVWMPPVLPAIEVLILLGLGLACALGSLWEGVFDEDTRNTNLALWLLGGAVLILAVGGASLRLSLQGGSGFSGMGGLLAGELRSFISSQGFWRWSGFAFLYAGSWVFFPKRKPTSQRVEGRVLGYV
ncbi:MAG: serine/threonine-protein kinase [Elusimicrobiota bacterium]|jgi:tRNA A-37 threonylcarbamoyl transferase component Bud32